MIRILLTAGLVAFGAHAQSTNPSWHIDVYDAVGAGQSSLASADFNRDGHLDIAVASLEHENIMIMLGDGRGNLKPNAFTPSGPSPTAISVSNINTDGHADLLIANHETTRISLLWGDGNGRFAAAPGSPLQPGINPHPHLVLGDDMDGDGHVDLLIDQRNEEGVLLLPGLNGGAFGEAVLIAVGGDPYRGMTIGDVNGDGLKDIITPNPQAVGVTLQRSQMRFAAPLELPVPRPFAVTLGDFNQDNALDIAAVTDGARSALQIFWGDEAGAFAEGSTFALSSGGKNLAVGDFDGNGSDDIVVTNWSDGVHMVLDFNQSSVMEVPNADHITNPWGLTVADLNSDGRDDIVVADGQKAVLAVYLSE